MAIRCYIITVWGGAGRFGGVLIWGQLDGDEFVGPNIVVVMKRPRARQIWVAM
jgi:hypothetical protein